MLGYVHLEHVDHDLANAIFFNKVCNTCNVCNVCNFSAAVLFSN